MDMARLPLRMFVVDDEPFALLLLCRQLANIGLSQVETFGSALDALQVLEKNRNAADVVICDLQMPVMDGVEFVRNLARIGFGGSLVLVSGEDERVLETVKRLAAAHRLNVLGALRKPTSPEAIRQLLSSQPLAQATMRLYRKAYSRAELEQAIAGDEMITYFQPKVALDDARVVGVEALARWLHPRDGLVCPDRFIESMEKNGMIQDLTRVVLGKTLRQASEWRRMGLDLHVAVNVSMQCLTDVRFADQIAALAADTNVPLDHLVLEVTETRLMQDPVAALDVLSRLRLRRVGLSIDDFGTGHSSLAQLRDIPFNELKLDRSFVHGASSDNALRTILVSNLDMAHRLGMRTVAEGVENLDDWELLRQIGFDLAQGYLIAPPMTGNQLPAWIGKWQKRRAALVDGGRAVHNACPVV